MKKEKVSRHSHLFSVGPSVSTKAGIAVTVTRSCVGVWDYMTGQLKYTLANSALGQGTGSLNQILLIDIS
jgi:hypothetical protein